VRSPARTAIPNTTMIADRQGTAHDDPAHRLPRCRAILFAIGVYTVIAQRSAVMVLMGIEVLLNAVGLNIMGLELSTRTP